MQGAVPFSLTLGLQLCACPGRGTGTACLVQLGGRPEDVPGPAAPAEDRRTLPAPIQRRHVQKGKPS